MEGVEYAAQAQLSDTMSEDIEHYFADDHSDQVTEVNTAFDHLLAKIQETDVHGTTNILKSLLSTVLLGMNRATLLQAEDISNISFSIQGRNYKVEFPSPTMSEVGVLEASLIVPSITQPKRAKHAFSLKSLVSSFEAEELEHNVSSLEEIDIPRLQCDRTESLSFDDALLQSFQFIDCLEKASHALTIRCNICYWVLGQRYLRYESHVLANRGDLQGRHRAKVVLKALSGEPALQIIFQSDQKVKALKKRLERARKFTLLTSATSVSILLAASRVNVTTLDKYRLRHLDSVQSSSSWENDEICSQKLRVLRELEATMMSGLKSLIE